MGGIGRNIRRRKKIKEGLNSVPDRFTSHDMSLVTGISPIMCGVLLKEFDEIENIGREPGMKNTTWIKIDGVVC